MSKIWNKICAFLVKHAAELLLGFLVALVSAIATQMIRLIADWISRKKSREEIQRRYVLEEQHAYKMQLAQEKGLIDAEKLRRGELETKEFEEELETLPEKKKAEKVDPLQNV